MANGRVWRSALFLALAHSVAPGVAERAARASLPPHADVDGVDITASEVRRDGGAWQTAAWDDLRRVPREPGRYQVRLRVSAGENATIRIPVCADRRAVHVDGRYVVTPPGPIVLGVGGGPHVVVMAVGVGTYERRIACGEPVRVGVPVQTIEGLGVLRFDSPHAMRGGGVAVVYVPPGHDASRPGPLLVGAHPWNGTVWTYAAYAELLRAARAHDVVLLMPSGLGNSLYAADAEHEVMRAISAVSAQVAVDPQAVSIWGASMGGAGSTTIAFHRPDRFASVTSFFGDSRYDLSTYVRAILPDQASAHRVNALDVVDNARNLPVWLIHGEADRTSPIGQSAALAAALAERGFPVRFDRVKGAGHSGALVARFLPNVVEGAAAARLASHAKRVTYRGVRAEDVGAYGVRITRNGSPRDAFVDIESRDDGVHVLGFEGVRAIDLTPGALGTQVDPMPPIFVDAMEPAPVVRWVATP